MKLRVARVRLGEEVDVGEALVQDSGLVEPKKGKPYFVVLLKDSDRHAQKEPCIGYPLPKDEDS